MSKKKGKEKKKGEEGEKKLPPPPNLDDHREGAQEALLTFKIQGKEEAIMQYEEEAEAFKERNYRQKEKNYDLKTAQVVHSKTLFQQAKEYDRDQASKEEVGKEMVERALWEKLQLAKETALELQEIEESLIVVERQLEIERKELDKWQLFKDTTCHKNEAYISAMKDQMLQMKKREKELQCEKDAKLSRAKEEIDQKWKKRMEQEKELVSEHLLNSLDKEGREEMVDNGWMKREIQIVNETILALKKEVDKLELRNLQLLEEMQKEQLEDLETSIELLQGSMGGSRVYATSSAENTTRNSPLPSLVDMNKCTSSRGPGGQLGHMERQLLNVQGNPAPFVVPPDTIHLPPIAQHKSTHSALPARTTWPITGDMLNSLA